ncbi:MAG TPA: Rpp14/Pop5 family protein [Geobacterales bacterium]|nr:Rpp14/Pop5 family protein [Geobacterales bacterium]
MKFYKRRYALVKFYDDLNKEELETLVENNFRSLFGVIDAAYSNIKLVFFKPNDKLAVFRLNNDYLDQFRATIFFLRDSKIRQARIILVSGTLKKIKLYIQENVKNWPS